MSEKLTADEFSKIENLVDAALYAPNKQAAKGYIQRLSFAIGSISGYSHSVLSEMVSAVSNASGAVSDKDWKVDMARQLLIKAKMFCVERE